MSTPSMQIVVSKCHSPIETMKALWRENLFQDLKREMTRYVWNILWFQKVRKCSKKDGDKAKVDRIQPEGASTGQILDNVSKVNNDMIKNYGPLNKIRLCKSTQLQRSKFKSNSPLRWKLN